MPAVIIDGARGGSRAATGAGPSTLRDDEGLAETVRRAVRREAQAVWGKKPMVHGRRGAL